MDTSALNYSMLGLTIATVVFAAGSLWAAVHYGRKSFRESKKANEMASERSVVKWFLERTDEEKAGEFKCLNIGHDSAYEVTVLAWTDDETVEATADVVPSSLEEADPERPSWIVFFLPKRQRKGPDPVSDPFSLVRLPPEAPKDHLFPVSPMEDAARQQQREMQERFHNMAEQKRREQVHVAITWRSEKGRWSTQELQTG